MTWIAGVMAFAISQYLRNQSQIPSIISSTRRASNEFPTLDDQREKSAHLIGIQHA